jgi:DNA ligase-1
MESDVWFEPALVLEVYGAELTISPIHTSGLAIRFPRFTGRFRLDKKPEDATTLQELWEMYERQLKKIETKPAGEAL